MHTGRALRAALALSACAVGLGTQTTFAPLERWLAAVKSGDVAAIAAFYSAAPPPQILVSTGVFTDTAREAAFWAEWKKAGLTRLGVSPISDRAAAPNLRQIGLEIGLHVQTVRGPESLYAFVQQTWMHQPGGWHIIGAGRSDLARLKQPLSLEGTIYSKTADAGAQIAAALREARREHKRVLLDFGGNWCYDCHVLDLAFRRSDLAPLLRANYVLVNIDVENFNYNLDIVRRYHLSIMQGVPMLAVLDSSGKVLASTSNGAFQAARALSPEDLIAFLDNYKPGA
jgi:thioredoxin 1